MDSLVFRILGTINNIFYRAAYFNKTKDLGFDVENFTNCSWEIVQFLFVDWLVIVFSSYKCVVETNAVGYIALYALLFIHSIYFLGSNSSLTNMIDTFLNFI